MYNKYIYDDNNNFDGKKIEMMMTIMQMMMIVM